MIGKAGRESWFTLAFAGALAGHLVLYRMQDNPLGRPEWPLLLDLLVTFPVAYLLLCRPGWKQWLKKCAGMLMFGLAFGSFAIPDASKHLWHEIDRIRLLAALTLPAEACLAI